MKDDAIKAMTNKGVPAEKAAKHWTTICDKLNDGDPLTREGLASLKDTAIEAALPPVAAAALIGLRDGGKGDAPAETPKGRKFKPGKTYSPAELAAFYPMEKGNPEYRAACDKITREAWVVVSDGKYTEVPSAKYLGWYADGVPQVPATIMVDGVPVAPIRFGEDTEPQEFYLDPFTPSAFLDPEMGSVRTGASFKDYSDESLSAMQFLYLRHLTGEGNLALNSLATANRGKGPTEILASFPGVLAEWNKTKPANRPAAKAAKRPFAEAATVAPRAPAFDLGATAPTSGAPQFMMVGARLAPAAANLLSTHLVTAKRQGTLVLTDDASFPTGCSEPHEVMRRFETSAAILVLVTANTIADDTIMALAARAQREKKPVVPVIVSACDWQESTLRGLVYLPRDDRFMTDERTGAVVASEVRTLAGKLKAPVATVSVAPSAREVCDAIIRLGIDRASLLAGIDRAFVATLRDAPTHASQMWQDIIAIWDLTLTDKSRPIRTYLKNALLFAANRPEARILEDALASC